MKYLTSRIDDRVRRIDWRSRGKLHGKKGPTASKFAIKALERVNRRSPGGQLWARLQAALK